MSTYCPRQACHGLPRAPSSNHLTRGFDWLSRAHEPERQPIGGIEMGQNDLVKASIDRGGAAVERNNPLLITIPRLGRNLKRLEISRKRERDASDSGWTASNETHSASIVATPVWRSMASLFAIRCGSQSVVAIAVERPARSRHRCARDVGVRTSARRRIRQRLAADSGSRDRHAASYARPGILAAPGSFPEAATAPVTNAGAPASESQTLC